MTAIARERALDTEPPKTMKAAVVGKAGGKIVVLTRLLVVLGLNVPRRLFVQSLLSFL